MSSPGRRTLRRRLGLERNPLRRPIDRIQRWIALALLLFTVAAAPPAALWCAGLAHDAGTRAERAERASRHQVTATVTAVGGVGSRGDRYVHETVQATWAAPDGGAREGTLPGWRDVRAGQTTRIWVDARGRVAPRPRPHSRTVTDTVYAGVAAALAAGAPSLLGYLLLRRRCDRRRDAMWDAAWARMDADAGRNHPF
ncbi:Rv1733c family protein [Actinomadura kijaniata]|uniref:Rv1733c family protein n=1 Tax=Actinomadura kijaniata TaxID=46161 RepID=UPI0008360FD8|nr:hypothetical protein [Actinomadura kijaniata]